MKKFAIAALILVAAASFADTITVTNRGRIFTVGTLALATRTNVDDFVQAPVLPALDVLRAARVGTDLTVGDDLTVAGDITTTGKLALGATTKGYFGITRTNLMFTVTETNGVPLASPTTRVVKWGIFDE